MPSSVPSLPSVRSLIAAVATGERSCADVARDALAAIENGAALGAFVTVNPQLMDDATRLDRERAAGRAGPLHGVPIAIKDNIETGDMPTTAGTIAFRNLRTGRNALVVARLRAGGALIVGKASLDELAIAGRGQSALGGQVRSPHDPSRHPAGSSGGSAVAVATGMAALALGTETVNSLRYPASATGTVAIRPTLGSVPGGRMFPQSACDVVGPMARSVGDAVLLLDVLRGGTGRPPPPRALHGARIGLVNSMMGGGPEHAGVSDAIAAALERLVECGASVVPIDEPTLATAPLYERLAVQVHEVAALFADYMAELHALPDVTGLERVRSLADLLDRGPHAPLVPPFLEAALQATPERRTKEVTQRRAEAAAVDRAVRALFEREQLDAVAYPLCQRPATRPIDEPSRPERNGILASALGWPALNLPVGTATEDGVTLPVGLDLTAPPEREADLLSLALAIEERINN